MSGAEAWSLYWAQADGGACLPGIPPALAERISGVWRELAMALPEGARVLDVASGGGAVLRVMGAARTGLILQGVDAAVVGPDAAGLGVIGGVPAESLPFADGVFEAVTAQFGLEYCAESAWAEAARVLKAGGAIRLLCHHGESAAVRHNRARWAAMRDMVGAGMFELARDMAAGQPEDAVRGPAVLAARQRHAAQSIVMELPVAIGQVLGRRDGAALLGQIERQARGEMARLAAMDAAALEEDAVRLRCGWLAAAGVLAEATVLEADGAPFAWVVRGQRA
jgi:SAM-dependent methyltransferase